MKKNLPELPNQKSTSLPAEAQEWLESHPKVNQDDMKLAWDWSGEADYKKMPLDHNKISEMRQSLEAKQSPMSLLSTRRWMLKMAASFLLLASLGIALWMSGSQEKIAVPQGETLAINLPDGSNVLLNSGSILRYDDFDSGERRVYLDGEGYFDVVKSSSPFTVETFNSETRVLGTSFNVRAWQDDPDPETILVLAEGKVSLSATNSVELIPGQMSRVKDGVVSEAAAVEVAQWLNWREGGIAFDNQKMANVLNELERRFGGSFTATSALKQDPISLFQNSVDSPEGVLESVCAALDCRFTKTAEGFQID